MEAVGSSSGMLGSEDEKHEGMSSGSWRKWNQIRRSNMFGKGNRHWKNRNRTGRIRRNQRRGAVFRRHIQEHQKEDVPLEHGDDLEERQQQQTSERCTTRKRPDLQLSWT